MLAKRFGILKERKIWAEKRAEDTIKMMASELITKYQMYIQSTRITRQVFKEVFSKWLSAWFSV